jgi:dipeptidyl aminopeptidase/acylaminoacyl peptidase
MMRFSLSMLALALCSCITSTLSAAEPQAAANGLIPIEQFTKFDEFGTVQISPNGENLAFTQGRYGRSMLLFLNRKDKKVTGGVKADDNREIIDFDWVSNDRIIYSLAERNPGEVTPSATGEIFAIDRDGGHHVPIYGYRAGESSTGTHFRGREASYASADVVSTLRSDDRNILITEMPWKLAGDYWRYDPDARPRITLLDTFNGKKKSLGTAPLVNASVLIDAREAVRFAIGLNEQSKLAVSWKPTSDAAWSAFDLPGFREESVIPRRFSTDNRSVLFTGVREGETFTALYRLDLESKQVERVYAFEGSDVLGVVSDFANREIVGARGYTDKPVYHWLADDSPVVALLAGLQRAFPNDNVRLVSATDDGKLAIAFVSSDRNPGDYYMFNTETKRADYMQSARKWIDTARMRPKRPIEITARDGMKLHGYVTEPGGDGPHPLVVLPHGGPYGVRDDSEFDWEAQLLASRGYTVLQMNFRGSGGYGMDFEIAGHRQWGRSMQDDVTDATHWAIEQKLAPADRICIFGASYGAYASLMGAVREPTLYRCAIGYAGVYDLELMLHSADVPKSKGGRAFLAEVLGGDVADLKSRSPAYNAEKIGIPVLLIHGKEDWRADYAQAKRMRDALEKNKKTYEWLVLAGEGHGVYDENSRREVYERILAFLDKNLRGT